MGVGWSVILARPATTVRPRSAPSRAATFNRWVLPTPNGPSTMTQLLDPCKVASKWLPNADSMCSRPTNGFMITPRVSLENRPTRAMGMTVSYLGAAVDTAAVDAVIRDFFAERRAEAEAFGQDFAATVAELESFILRGGKRIRPAFAWLGWIGAGGDPQDQVATAVLSACAGFELLHAAGLIHDDIIDASQTRRGDPAARMTYAERHRARRFSGAPDAFGTGTAIVIGDLALTWADVLVRASGLPADAQARVSPVWSAVRSEVMYGQLLDLINQASDDEDVDAALRVNQYKTASYTVERPLQFGAAIAGADAELVAAYRAFGADIGIAFQLRDDMRGVFGDPTV